MSEKLRFGRAMSDNLFSIVIMVLLELCLLIVSKRGRLGINVNWLWFVA